MVPNNSTPLPHIYSATSTFIFWILWLFGAAICLLFTFFFFITMGSPIVAIWNLLVAIAQSFILIKSLRHFDIKEIPVSELMLWAVFAGVGMPLIAFGGCTLIPFNLNLH